MDNISRRLRNAINRINTVFSVTKIQITPHLIWYNRVAKNYKPSSKKGVILIPMIPYKQLSLADVFSDCQEKFENDKPAFLSLLETHIDIDEIIPISFRNHFYASTGRTRKYPLQAFL